MDQPALSFLITRHSSESCLSRPEVRIGFLPALVAVFLRRQIGEKYARELLLTGKIIDAADALRMGLINEIVSTGDLMMRAHEVADGVVKCSPSSVMQTKKLFHLHDEKSIRSELEVAIELNAEIRSTDDFREGLAAFLEKRPPRWSGTS